MILAAVSKAPSFDFESLAPLAALAIGMVVALLAGLLPGRLGRATAVWTGVAATIAASIVAVTLWDEPTSLRAVARSLIIDQGALVATIIVSLSALAGIAFASRSRGTEDAGHGETASLILASAVGAGILASANDLVTLFLGLELLSIPLYVLCASHVDRTASLESGLKYLILGSVGSATALMGIAFIYGATGEMHFEQIAAVAGNAELAGLLIPGVALLLAGFAFKLSLAPLHQWTPDVYDGAPTAVTAFMSVATKAAALVVTARLVLTAFGTQELYDFWHPVLIVLAAASIIVGNVGALGQPSMKRLMGYSSVAQAGYLVAAISVGAFGSMLTYLIAYSLATMAVFAVVSAREAERPELGDDVAALDGLGRERPLLAWIGTIGLFGLAGLPLTAGFFGKIAVAGALINGGPGGGETTWLAVLLIIGSIISLAYYAPPVLRMWRSAPAPAAAGADGGSGAGAAGADAAGRAGADAPLGALVASEADAVAAAEAGDAGLAGGGVAVAARPKVASGAEAAEAVATKAPLEIVLVGVVAAAATVALGVWPQPLLELAGEAARTLLGGG